MKVLWVCNIMLPVIAEKLGVEGSNKEGWLSGLCDTIMRRRQENNIELHVAYPIQITGENRRNVADFQVHKISLPEYGSDAVLYAYGFLEDVIAAEKYDEALEKRMKAIVNRVQPDVIHCFGTEYGHALALARGCEHPERILIGLQGLCDPIAKAYMADLPMKIQKKVTFRDWLKKDSIRRQQQKFMLRGQREQEILALAGNVTGRTEFDRLYTKKWSPSAKYYSMNETLRGCFYEGEWKQEKCEPHTIFISQGDYPLKGLHYLLLAVGRLKEKYPDIKVKVAGNSLVNCKKLKDKLRISAYGTYLRQLMKESQLQDRVNFLGKLTAEEMKTEYLSCGLFVCCSSNENSPNSLGEAMLLGVPCVAADVGGISSIFSGGVDGILYQGFTLESDEKMLENDTELLWSRTGSDADNEKDDKNNKCNQMEISLGGNGKKNLSTVEKTSKNQCLEENAERLADAVAQVWDNPEQTEEFCKNARKHAKNTHDKELNYQKMTEIYAKIASQNSILEE